MRFVISRGWQKIEVSGSGMGQNVSPRAAIEVSKNEDNGGLIIFPGQVFPYEGSFYARKHLGGGPCVLAVLEGAVSIPVTIDGGGSGSSSGSDSGSGDTGYSEEDIDCLFETHSEHVSGSGLGG